MEHFSTYHGKLTAVARACKNVLLFMVVELTAKMSTGPGQRPALPAPVEEDKISSDQNTAAGDQFVDLDQGGLMWDLITDKTENRIDQGEAEQDAQNPPASVSGRFS